ncbi:MAG TPA: PIF1 family ATP-dependent DNA helicase [Rickettsiales bacterium]|nr:PIF1 family ATP-dependent DNA helicase [Rickettsiales bacterium]
MYLSLSETQRLAVDKIAEGKNVFITGPAGTGKSFLLNYLKDEYKTKNLHITASTGIAAINVGGQTLHSWAGLGLGNLPLNETIRNILSVKGTYLRRKLRSAKILAIDEISMISAEVFDMLNNLLKAVRQNERPFGGIQLILFGDFLQLPPINKESNEIFFCFESEAWQEAKIETITLKEIFRQSEKDLVNLLNNLRFGELTKYDLELLRGRFKKEDLDKTFEATILGTHNIQVEKINITKLNCINGCEKTYKAKFEGKPEKIEFLRRNCIVPEELTLKIGAQVMMLKNTFVKEGVINGSIGIVRSFDNKKGYPIVEFTNGALLTITPNEWAVSKFNENTAQVEVEAMMIQIPLVLSWAITIHKSQGMTLEKIRCNLGSAFAEGQVYVAISRVKSLGGLFIDSFNINNVKINKKVIKFYKEL